MKRNAFIHWGLQITLFLAEALSMQAFGCGRSCARSSASFITGANYASRAKLSKKHQNFQCWSLIPDRLQQSLLTRFATSGDSSESERLEKEVFTLNNGVSFNLNSPKQVAIVIFGRQQSTSRQILEKAANSDRISETKRRIAQLVLNYRDLAPRSRSVLKRKKELVSSTRAAKFSTVPDFVESSSDETINGIKFLSSPTSIEASITPYDEAVSALFQSKSKIDNHWRDPLLQVTKPSARSMVLQLNPSCPMGYDPTATPHDGLRGTGAPASDGSSTAGKKGSLLHYVREQKERHAHCLLLVRVGEFYESFGLDAVMLVEHCGLNAMAGKARAGCPIRNIQATLDCLTRQGFAVAVYEEAADTDAASGASTGGSKARLKNRMLAQIVSSASPTYLYDLVLLGNADALVTSPSSRPYVGVISLSSGYTLVEVSMEERSVRVSERLTAEAVACRLAAYPPADPLLYVPPPGEYEASMSIREMPFLPSRWDTANHGPGSKPRTKIVPPILLPAPSPGVTDVERAKDTIVLSLLQMTDQANTDLGDEQPNLTANDFTLVSASNNDSNSDRTHTNPLYVETATQLGLMSDPTIPPLVSYLLPDSAPASARRFLRRWLLTPPPPTTADAMSTLVSFLKDEGPPLPPLSVPPIGKLLALLRSGQASAKVYGELLCAMRATTDLLDAYQFDTDVRQKMVNPLMSLVEYESGIKADPLSLQSRCLRATDVVESVVSPLHHPHVVNDGHDVITSFDELIPRGFFERNENTWRGRVKIESAQEAYDKVEASAIRLAEAVAADFFNLSSLANLKDQLKHYLTKAKSPIVQDVFNNLFAIREVPQWVEAEKQEDYVHPRDRNGKLLRNRYTTKRVRDALTDYVTACDEARQQVTDVLTELSLTLCEEGHLPAVVQAAHSNLILSAAAQHAAKANVLGWHMATTYEQMDDGEDVSGHFNRVIPYWMDRSEAVDNTFDLTGMFILTAPNMSGKSTLMRSTAAASLLANCGLCSPVGPGSSVRRFDSIFVRGASSDVPTEQKSAFGAEMQCIASLFRSCGSKSLIFVDELGRGTSPKDGTCIAGAVLEAMLQKGMTGIFATHLHDILNLPLTVHNGLATKRMSIHERGNKGDYVWTYRLEDGICTDSMALVTARRFGLPPDILERATQLATDLENGQSSFGKSVSDSDFSKHHLNEQPNGLEDVLRIVKDTAQNQGSIHVVRPRWSPPSSLEGKSCVYILKLDTQPCRYYVGETDDLRRRFRQHRSKGDEWLHAPAIVLHVKGGKTSARNAESLVIRKLAKSGFAMQSVLDGQRRVRPAWENVKQEASNSTLSP